MNRLGLMHPSELPDDDARKLYEDYYRNITTKYGNLDGIVALLGDNVLVGPFGVQLHTPDIGQHHLRMSEAIYAVPGLTSRNRELAILVTSAKFDTAYQLYVHKALAKREGMPDHEIERIARGERPETLSEDGKAVYDAAYELVHGRGPLSQSVWDSLVDQISKAGATALVHLVGLYSYIAIILNGFDSKIPEKEG